MAWHVVRVERDLRERLRAAAREDLGPAASEAEVEAVDDEYWGPRLAGADREETPEEPEVCERDHARRVADVRRWGLPPI